MTFCESPISSSQGTLCCSWGCCSCSSLVMALTLALAVPIPAETRSAETVVTSEFLVGRWCLCWRLPPSPSASILMTLLASFTLCSIGRGKMWTKREWRDTPPRLCLTASYKLGYAPVSKLELLIDQRSLLNFFFPIRDRSKVSPSFH